MSAPPAPTGGSISMRERSILSVLRRFSERNPNRAFPFETHPAYFREVAVRHGLATAADSRATGEAKLPAAEGAPASSERAPELTLAPTQPAAVRDLASGHAEASPSSEGGDPTRLGVPLVPPEVTAQGAPVGGVPGLALTDTGAGASALGQSAVPLGAPPGAAPPGAAPLGAPPAPTFGAPSVYTQGVLAGTARLQGPATDLHAPPTLGLQAQAAPQSTAAAGASSAPVATLGAAPLPPQAQTPGVPNLTINPTQVVEGFAQLYRRLTAPDGWIASWREAPQTRLFLKSYRVNQAAATGNGTAGDAIRLVKQLRSAREGREQLELILRWYYRFAYVPSVLQMLATREVGATVRVVKRLIEEGVNGPRGVNAPQLALGYTRGFYYASADEDTVEYDALTAPGAISGALKQAIGAAFSAATLARDDDASVSPGTREGDRETALMVEARAGVVCEGTPAPVFRQNFESQRPSAEQWRVLARVAELMESWADEPQASRLLAQMREIPYLRQIATFVNTAASAAAAGVATKAFTAGAAKIGGWLVTSQPWLGGFLIANPAIAIAGGVAVGASVWAAAATYNFGGQIISILDADVNQLNVRQAARPTTFFRRSFANDVFFSDVNNLLARTGLGQEGGFIRALASLQVEVGDSATYETMQGVMLDLIQALAHSCGFLFESEQVFVQYFHGFLYQPLRVPISGLRALQADTTRTLFGGLRDLFPAEFSESLNPVGSVGALDINPITGHTAMGGLRSQAETLSLENCFFFPHAYETTTERADCVARVRAEYGDRELRGVEWDSVPTWSGVYATDFIRRLYGLKLAQESDTRPDPPDLPGGVALQLPQGNSEQTPGQPNLAPQDTTGGMDPRGIEIALARVQAQRQKLAEKYYDGTSESVDPQLTARGAQRLPPARSHPLFRVDGYRRYEGDDPSNPLAMPRAEAESANLVEAAAVMRAEAKASSQPPAKNSALLNSAAYQAALDESSYNTASYFRPARVRYELRDDAHTTEPSIDLRSHDVQQQRLARLQPPEPERDFSGALRPPKRQRHALWGDQAANPRADAQAKLAHFLRQ